jgi:hypothetical protein
MDFFCLHNQVFVSYLSKGKVATLRDRLTSPAEKWDPYCQLGRLASVCEDIWYLEWSLFTICLLFAFCNLSLAH